VGGDPHLNVVRAELSAAGGDLEEARRVANRAITEEPTLVQGDIAVLVTSVRDDNYKQTWICSRSSIRSSKRDSTIFQPCPSMRDSRKHLSIRSG
jgi:hypothetical protein